MPEQSETNREGLIYDWNSVRGDFMPRDPIQLDDETLRDGIQGPSVTDPPIEEKKELLLLMDAMGIDTADVGLPGAGPRAVEDVTALSTFIRDRRLKLRPNCAARTLVRDVEPIARISQRVGIPIEACLFIGSSPIRQYSEDWTLETLLQNTRESVRFAVKEGLPVMYVTEDTTRAHPETLRALYTAAIECGARRVCVCDTVGHSMPEGADRLVRHVCSIVESTGEKVGVDWHGHRDRDMAVINTLAAIRAGATRVHGCALGVGERAGNTPMDLVLVNLKLLGWIDRDLTRLREYCQAAARSLKVGIPRNYPIMGQDAFETGTGVHAAAVIKAFRKGDEWLADRVYSGVPAGDFGLKQRIRIGPMSGKSNVTYWLEERGIPAETELVDRILAAAKRSSRLLEDPEILALVRGEELS
ncbi:MAG TPA: LeuA family protein [Candidatus Polarisedimenticolia bacterium]|jgi:2-isopropylmalate synthase|nr:LeuA family protein [Candidatus Polarisedimenticolia bacterium]